MQSKGSFQKYALYSFAVSLFLLLFFILFRYPQPGVADQGDFDRVMSISNLRLSDADVKSTDFQRFFKYLVPKYKISKENTSASHIFVSSIALPIKTINFFCGLLGSSTFKTAYLAALYGLLYILSFYLIIKYMNIESKPVLIVSMLLCSFIFFDGNYLIWFNSLYGEPMMLISLLLYIASWMYYYHCKALNKPSKNLLLPIAFILLCCFMFLGSKMQVITALPVIFTMLMKLLYENAAFLGRIKCAGLFTLVFIISVYPLAINMKNKGINNDIKYNSVFYGVLKNSNDPRQDLIAMNLNPEMAVEAGKHSYLAAKDYVKYFPHSKTTEKEFYSKISSLKLVKFYITHPNRLLQGMEYTARQAFNTSTSLGHYERAYSETPVRSFSRFVLWSYLKSIILPKSLSFIILFYVLFFTISLKAYLKTSSKSTRDKFQLLWAIAFIGILQFPMPFIGNGRADTGKQLFLFNFIFDILISVSLCFVFYKLISLIRKKRT